MRNRWFAGVMRALIVALMAMPLMMGPAQAQTAVAPKDVTAGDVVTKPLADLNLMKDDVPPILLAARARPYDLTGLKTCAKVQDTVHQLDAVLGDDIDVAEEKSLGEKRGNTVGGLAKSIMGSLIPFGGIIREISGANANERQWQLAIYAGATRRAFLKGYGQQKGCRYPARAATARDIAALVAARAAAAGQPTGQQPGPHRR